MKMKKFYILPKWYSLKKAVIVFIRLFHLLLCFNSKNTIRMYHKENQKNPEFVMKQSTTSLKKG